MNIRQLDAVTVQALAVSCVSIANVWLVVQNARWFMYSPLIKTLMPHVNIYTRFDPVLEIPGIALGIIASYILVFRFTLSVWRIRQSIFRDALATRVLSINSILLVILTALGITQWTVWFRQLPFDVIAIAFFGAVAALVSYFLERRLTTSGQFTLSIFFPLHPLRSLASMWHRSKIS